MRYPPNAFPGPEGVSVGLKLLVDGGYLVVGGGIHVGLEFHRYLSGLDEFDIHWRLAPPLKRAMEKSSVGLPARWTLGQPPPLRRIRQFRTLVRELQPDCVFSVLGPPNWSCAPIPHVSGFARGFCLNPDSLAWKHLDRRSWLRIFAVDGLLTPRFLRNADYYWVETAVARERLLARTDLAPDRVVVTGNTCAEVFRTWKPNPSDPPALVRRSEDEFLLLTVASWYSHKNLELIPEVARDLVTRERRPVRFILTLEREGPHWKRLQARARELGVEDVVTTVGHQHPAQLPALYDSADVMFLPTLLETFSAAYPEAMAGDCAIVTTDLDFAHAICGDAAQYFEALNPGAAADAIGVLINDEARVQELLEAGRRQLETFPDSNRRGEIVVDLIRTACSQGR